MKFYKKTRRTYSRVYSGHNFSCIFNEANVIPLPETYYFDDVLQNWNRLLVECRKPDHLIVVAAIWSVSGVAVTLLVSRLTVDIFSTFC